MIDVLLLFNEFISIFFISLLCILYFYDNERCKMNFPVRDNKVLLYCIVLYVSAKFLQIDIKYRAAACVDFCQLQSNSLVLYPVSQRSIKSLYMMKVSS